MADCKDSTEETNGPRPPKMKFDPPEEPSEDSTNENAEEHSSEEDSEAPPPKVSRMRCSFALSSSMLLASKLRNSFGVSEHSKYKKPKPMLLRPSALSSVTTTGPGPSSKESQQRPPPQPPSKSNNPFTKVSYDVAIDDSGATNDADGDEKNENKETAKIGDDTKHNDGNADDDASPKFLPLVTNPKETESNVNNSTAASNSSNSTSSFVFGQNLKERVAVSSDAAESSASTEKDEPKDEAAETNENEASELLFSSAATACKSTTRSGLTLTQAAQEMEEASRANKRKYSQITPLTGEEEETNVLQINCKLFAFDKATSSWQERGRGTLRLNDRDEESRIVGRAAGTQRLVLNTKIWPGMTAEKAGPKSLRLTAMDVQGDAKIFVVQAAPKEVDLLHGLLLQRLKQATERQMKKLASERNTDRRS